MSGYEALTVLVPTWVRGQPGTHLTGFFTSSSGADSDRTCYVIVLTSCCPPHISPLGTTTSSTTRPPTSSVVWVELQTDPCITLRSLTILQRPVSLADVNLVIYDAQEICQSELLDKKYVYKEDHDHANDIVPYFIHCVQKAHRSTTAHTSTLGSLLHTSALLVMRVLLLVWWLPQWLLAALHSILVRRLDYTSCALQQILLRIAQLGRLRWELEHRPRGMLAGRLLVMVVLDVALGVLVASVISSYASVDDLYSSFCNGTKVVAGGVHRLLEWLSGAPAGLKLNQPLTTALSAFFSYHVHLWRLYLELSEPVLRGLAWGLVWLGWLGGASVQVAVLSDLLDLATLHLYCFYVYAARIHMLQIWLLGSQWRAFRGRKWNPLKGRVDGHDAGGHVSLRRVLSAVVFTLAVFLLPTTTIYYLVFVLLRVGLMGSRGGLATTIWLLNTNPLHLMWLRLASSRAIRGDIYFSTCPSLAQGEEGPLQLRIHTWPTPLAEVLAHVTPPHLFPPRPSPHFKFLVLSVMFGENLL